MRIFLNWLARNRGKRLYQKVKFKPLFRLNDREDGHCPHCSSSVPSKIVWGWHGVYYDLICENGHSWTFRFRLVAENHHA